ncbi:MAG: AIM24 family protein [Tepidisphaeraceae bacterium]
MSQAISTTDGHHYRCSWCGMPCDAAVAACPSCGSPTDVRAVVSRSGWSELPAIPDMAKLQFGQSTCQIEGAYVPVADFKLAAGDGVYFAHHLLLWKDDAAKISAMSLARAWKRLFAGMPLVMTEATGPGRVAFSKDKPGELVALPLEVGQSVDVREHVFMVATKEVDYDWFDTGIWFRTSDGKESETHYPIGMFMDRFTATSRPGLLLLHGAGNVFVRRIEAGHTILVKPTSLLFKDPTVEMHLHFEHPAGTWRSWQSWGNRYLWLRLRGPGRVAVQSNYEPMEDPGYDMTGHEPGATRRQW